MSFIHVLKKYDEQDGIRYKCYTTLHPLDELNEEVVSNMIKLHTSYSVNGDITVVQPEDVIWTHRPVPVDFDLVAAKHMFENLALKVLSDYDSAPTFEPASSYCDMRYADISVRSAWMVFIEREVTEMIAHILTERRLKSM